MDRNLIQQTATHFDPIQDNSVLMNRGTNPFQSLQVGQNLMGPGPNNTPLSTPVKSKKPKNSENLSHGFYKAPGQARVGLSTPQTPSTMSDVTNANAGPSKPMTAPASGLKTLSTLADVTNANSGAAPGAMKAGSPSPSKPGLPTSPIGDESHRVNWVRRRTAEIRRQNPSLTSAGAYAAALKELQAKEGDSYVAAPKPAVNPSSFSNAYYTGTPATGATGNPLSVLTPSGKPKPKKKPMAPSDNDGDEVPPITN